MSASSRPQEAEEHLSVNGPGTVGEILRSQRQAHGISLDEIATILRIRPTFLSALEQGRHDLLPGSTYAIGFVRTYAEHLGLDGIALVNQFKREAAGIDRRTTLTFPSPAPDGRVPGFWPLSVAVLALLAIAGGWYVLRGDLAPLPPRVASVPERLAPPPPPPPPAPAVDPDAASAPAATDTASSAASEPAPAQSASLGTPSSTTPSSSVTPALSESPRVASAVPEPVAPPPAATPAPPVAAPAQPEPEASPPSATALLAAPPAKPEAVQPTVPAAAPGDGRVFGAQNDAARVVIHAHGESWIQVRDAANNAVLSRVLRAGDTYRVPNQPGLTMMTGNAGNLDVMVDGDPAPALGPVGLVKRNIALDPDRLRRGQ